MVVACSSPSRLRRDRRKPPVGRIDDERGAQVRSRAALPRIHAVFLPIVVDGSGIDFGVGLHRLWFRRDEWGRIKFWRLYEFEFASGANARYKGRAITLGRRILDINLEPYPAAGPETKDAL